MDRNRLILIVGLVVLMGVVFVTLQGLGGAADEDPEVLTVVQKIDYTRVLSTSEPLDKGDRVREGDLVWIDWPTDALTSALITEEDGAETPVTELLDGALVREPLTPGEPLVMSRFIKAGDAGIMAALLNPGMRAVTVRISVDTASGGFIQPGDKVDIILQETIGGNPAVAGAAVERVTASTIFEDVTVLAIDQAFSNDPEGGAAIPGSTATLELSPRDVERITVAQARGDLSLVLRGFAGANSWAPTRAKAPQDSEKVIPPLTIYRSGSAQSVAVRGN